jgi:hypothetical protein
VRALLPCVLWLFAVGCGDDKPDTSEDTGPGRPHARLTLSRPSVVADGVDETIVTLSVVDASGQPSAGVDVTLEIDGSANTLDVTTGTTSLAGTLSAHLKSTRAEAKHIVAYFGDFRVATSVEFIAGPANPSTSSLAAAPAALQVGATTTLTATIRDAYGNAVPQQQLTFSVSGQQNALVPIGLVTDAAGQITAALSSTKAEAKDITILVAGYPLFTAATFTPGPPSMATSRFVVGPRAVVAAGMAAARLVIILRDQFKNPTPGHVVTFGATGSGNTFTPSTGTTDNYGQVIASMSSSVAENKTVSAAAGPIDLSAAIKFIAPQPCGSPRLPTVPGVISSGFSSTNLAHGDVDGDGVTDVVIAAQEELEVLRGVGDGTFAPGSTTAENFGQALFAPAVTVVDVDDDGLDDVVVASPNTDSVIHYRSTGAGALALGTPHMTGASYAVAHGDVDEDGKQDLVVLTGTELVVMLNDGAGGFATPTRSAVAGRFDTAEVADLNADQHLDVLLVGRDVAILHGDGSGGFSVAQMFDLGAYAVAASIGIGDLDADGQVELAIGMYLDVVHVFRHDAAGQFVLAQSYPVDDAPQIVAFADVDDDGALDLVAISDFPTGVSVLRGDGAGAFGPAAQYLSNGASDLIVADLNGDSITDVVVGHVGMYGIQILLGSAGDGLQGTLPLPMPTPPSGDSALSDLDGDGDLDLVRTELDNNALRISLGDGSGAFGSPSTVPTSDHPSQPIVADFDVDGIPDIAILGSALPTVTVHRGAGDGTFANATTYVMSTMPTVGVATDIDRDHDPDLVLFNRVDGDVSILRSLGDGTFATPIEVNVGAPYIPGAVVDVNSNGSLDIVVARADQGTVVVLSGNGDGTFGAPSEAATTGHHPYSVVAGDFNADAKPDLAVVGNDPFGLVTLLGDGTGTFAPSTPVPGVRHYSLTVADIDADGVDDVLASDLFQFGFWRGNGDGTFERERVYWSTWLGASLGDLNGDALPELVDSRLTEPPRVFPNHGCPP